MNIVKVYDKNGKHVDSFKKQQSAQYYHSIRSTVWNTIIRHLNKTGYCVKRQLADLKRTQLGAL